MKKKGFLLLVALLLIIGVAYFAYDYLSQRYAETPETTPPSDVTEPAGEPVGDPAGDPAGEQKTAAPDFDVFDMDGNVVRLSDFRGKPVVINFWATWCGPCRSELQAFNDAYAAYGKDISFMMVNLTDGARETEEGVRGFVAENGYSFPVYFDELLIAANAYGIYSIPLSVFVDADGDIVAMQLGAMNESMLQSYINSLLG